jgi:MATE family multidrug resistance protein
VNLARRIVALAWPVFVSQLAVVLSGTIDTVVTGHASANDLAAMAVGAAIYSSIYVGLMGVVMALNPIVANRIGANDLPAAGRALVDGLWMALLLAVVGGVAIGYPGLWVSLSHVTPQVGTKISGYLAGLVFALPAAILFRAIYAFNTGIGRPKLVMIINLIGLALKLPLDIVLVFGHFGVPQMGAAGCANTRPAR